MTTTPILGITQVAPNQSGKEAVINTAILALEAATNGTLTVPVTTADATLSQSQFLSAILFKVTGLTAARALNIPTQINGVNTQRVFSVRNMSSFSLTVQVNGGGGTVVVIPAGQTRLMDVDGAANINIIAQNPQNSLSGGFVNLTDTPQSYTGQAKKVPQVNATENGLQFIALAVASLADVDVATTAPTNGQTLVWNATSVKWLPGTPAAPSVALAGLTDVNVAAVTNGQVLTYNTATSKWIAATIAAASVATLSDATITTPANGQVLTYSSATSKWINQAAALGALATLTDITLTSVANGQVLTYNSATSKWINGAAASGSLAGLTDVNVPTPGNGQVLSYNTSTSKWIAATIAAASVATLTDAVISSPSNGQVLTYDSATSKWKNVAPASGGASALSALTDVLLASSADAQVLTYEASTSKWKNKPLASAVGGGAWIDIAFGASITLFGNTVFPSPAITLAAGDVLEVELQVNRASGQAFGIFLSPDATNAYNPEVQGDNNYVLYRITTAGGAQTVLNGGVVNQTHVGAHELKLEALVGAGPSNRVTTIANGSDIKTATDVNVNLVGSNIIYVQSPSGALTEVKRARYRINGGKSSGNTTSRFMIPFFFTSAPLASETLGLYIATDAFTFSANFASSKGVVGTNPTAAFTITVNRQVNATGAFAAIGTISISTAGAVTFATTGGTAINIAANDVLQFVAQSSADATVANAAFNLRGN